MLKNIQMNHDREPQRGPLTIEQVAAIAKETILRDGYHIPMMLVDGSKNHVAIQITEVGDTFEERQRQMFQAGFALAQENVIGSLEQVFFVTEAWMSAGTQDKEPVYPPSQDPNRKEILFISCLNVLTRENEALTFEMIRDAEGKLVELTQLQRSTEAESPLLNAFVVGFAMGLGGTVL